MMGDTASQMGFGVSSGDKSKTESLDVFLLFAWLARILIAIHLKKWSVHDSALYSRTYACANSRLASFKEPPTD